MSIKNITGYVAITIMCLSILYFFSKGTITAYESEVSSNVSAPVARWNIFLDSVSMTDHEQTPIHLKNIAWDNLNSNSKTVAPGSKGKLKIEIDPMMTEVSVRFDITFVDHIQDENYLLNVESVTINEGNLIKTSENTYTGLFTLKELSEKKRKIIWIELLWENDETKNNRDSEIGNGSIIPIPLSLEMTASQYNGETITEYR